MPCFPRPQRQTATRVLMCRHPVAACERVVPGASTTAIGRKRTSSGGLCAMQAVCALATSLSLQCYGRFRYRHRQMIERRVLLLIALAVRTAPALKRRRVTPHMLRHSCAVALLQAGVGITVIRDYLGHASISTTSRYVSTNLQMRRDALEHFWNRSGLAPARTRAWSPKPDLLAYLASI